MTNRCSLIFFVVPLIMNACGIAPDGNEKEGTTSSERSEERATIEEIEKGIKTHIDERTEEGDGYFHVETDSQELELKLVRVHTEFLANLGPQRHFACVDLAEEDGDVYDVDFFLEGKPGDMEVTQTTVHKLNGRPFYTWEQHEDGTWHRVPVEDAGKKLMGVVEGSDRFEFRYEAELPDIEEEARMWAPIAQSGRFQDVELKSMKAPGEKRMLEEKAYGNKVLYLELGPEHSGETVRMVYDVKRKEKDPYKAESNDPRSYLSSEPLIPVGGRFEEIADSVLEGKEDETQLLQARALYDYIMENVEYQKAGKYGTGDAEYACDARSGNCTEFHSFFLSLARSAGIPARFQIGAGIPSERDRGGITGYHCWAEFYAEGKWWPVDVSEGNKYQDLASYYFGHHPANRIALSRGRDLELDPGPRSGRIDFLAYPILEIGNERDTVETKFSFQRRPKGGSASASFP